MQATDPRQFRHTTLAAYPEKIVGVTLLDETPGFTGIYLRDQRGGLWPAHRQPDPRQAPSCRLQFVAGPPRHA